MSDNQINHGWNTHGYLNTYVQIADAKAGVVMALAGAAILFVLQLETLSEPNAPTGWAYSGAAFFVAAFIAAFLAVSPKLLTQQGSETPLKSLRQSAGIDQARIGMIFWGSITQYGNAASFLNALSNADADKLLNEVASHCFELSVVLTKKYWHLEWAMRLVIVGFALVCIYLLKTKMNLSTGGT